MLHIISFLLQLGFKKLVVSLVVVVFIIVIYVMVVFVLAHCRNMLNSVPHGDTAAEALISSSAVVHEGSPELQVMLYIITYGMAAAIKMAW